MASLVQLLCPADGFTYPRIIALTSAIVTIGLFAIAYYRLILHPLAKFPGPLWARLTTFPSYWHTLKGDRHVWLWSLQQQYG